MLAAAKLRLPHVNFEQIDLNLWRPGRSYDVIFSSTFCNCCLTMRRFSRGWRRCSPQGCSTLFTEGHRKYGFETAESGGVAVLRDGVGLIEPENIVGEASNSREDARIFSNARCIFA